MCIHRLLRMPRRLLDVALSAFVAFSVAACVHSEQPLLSDSEQLFGDSFQLNVFETVTDLASPVKTAAFRWSAGRYNFVKGETVTQMAAAETPSIVVKQINRKEILVQVFNGTIYQYYVARLLVPATYKLIPVDHGLNDLKARQGMCVNADPLLCVIRTRAQLDALLRASAGKSDGAFWGLAVLSKPE